MIMMFTACSDELENGTRYADGMLHFKFLFDKQGQWNDDGASGPKTRMMAPIEMTLPEGFSTPLYLHCVESNEIETAPEYTTETRGERITGEAFDDRNKIQCFGLYAVVDGQQVLATSTSGLTASYTEIKRSELTASGDWQVKEATLNFAGDGGWPDGETGDFYGFAPFPGWDADEDAGNGHARCIYIDTDTPAPTIYFSMQEEEEHNKDILTARQTGVSKDDKDAGVKLQFQHILSALKFKLDDDDTDGNGTNDLKYTVGIGGTEYYMQVKSITVDGIYDQGHVEIGNAYTDAGGTRTSNWVVEGTSKGSCTATLDRSYDEVTTDSKKLINTDEHCMMVLPQKTPPEGAKLIITVDLTADEAGTVPFKTNVTFEASLKGLTWLPGYSYTYKISKDTKAKNYTLTSKYGGTDGGAFTVSKDGGSYDFEVLSNVEVKDESTPAETLPAKWHIESSTDGGSTWQQGLPLGFSVIKKSSGERVDGDLVILNSSTAAETYTLVAEKRTDNVPTINTLTSHDYNIYADDDRYYDLSLHGMGYSDEVCNHTSARNTANCYIINGFGKFKLPLVYGNGVKQGVNNPRAYAYTWDGKGHGVFLDHKGNQINDPWITTQVGPQTGAKIVWKENEVINEKSVKLSDDGDYLCFEIKQEDVQPGNVLLAVYDADGIAWSWHIWVTAFDYANNTTTLSCNVDGTPRTMTFAQRNLGWRTPEIKNYNDSRTIRIRVVQNDAMSKHVEHNVTQNGGVVSLAGSNIVYQNGRKDPFPFLRTDMTDYTTNPSTGKITSMTFTTNIILQSVGCSIYDDDRPTVDFFHKNPEKYLGTSSGSNASNWFSEAESTYPGRQTYPCWDPEANIKLGGAILQEFNYTSHTKTIYDPCPVGFMVPKSGALTILNYTSYTSSTNNTKRTWSYKTETTTLDNETVTSPLPYIEAGDIRFYLTGGMTYSYTGGGHATLQFNNTNTYGYIWSTGFTSDASYNVYGRSSQTGFEHRQASNDRYSMYGIAVRPVVDDQQGTLEAWGGGVVETFHQGDVENVELTETSSGNWGLNSSNISSVIFDVKDASGNHVTDLSLSNFLSDSSKKNRRVYIKNVHVEFTYNGFKYGILVPRTSQTYSIVYTNGTKEETQGSRANVLVSTIPDHYQFSPKWARWNPADLFETDTWKGLVPLTTQRVNITKVTADLRVSYYTD